jgi:hypothetical protein
VTLNLDWNAINTDFQHIVVLQSLADEIVADVIRHTSVDIDATRGEVEQGPDGPFVIIGAKAAAAVSVEFGTLYRRASAPIRRAAMALGLKVPN